MQTRINYPDNSISHTSTQPHPHTLAPASVRYINLKLASLGCPTYKNGVDPEFNAIAAALLSHQRETDRLLASYLCPADRRIQDFLDRFLGESAAATRLPVHTLVLDRPGLARDLSLPPDQDSFISDILHSYRVKQGVLHNPVNDRRTTQGVFHIAEGGFPVPADKISVPTTTFARLLQIALHPPREIMRLPFTSSQQEQAECFVSLLLRPLVCPAVPGCSTEKRLETRFFAPGNLVSNLDFVESIFGNGGDPALPENDAGLDVEHWTGQTGCVILAPHLPHATKKEVGLPHWDKATERQRRDGMCWQTEEELYHGGKPFKITCRDPSGVIITLIADSYFGYCKKEVKGQISFSANLNGFCEEEHAGGALVYPSYDLGEDFSGNLHVPRLDHNFSEVLSLYGGVMDLQPEGYGIDRQFPDILYVPGDVRFDLHQQTVTWPHGEGESRIKLLPGKTYVRPSGYKVHMEKPPGSRDWRLVGTMAEGTLCHKPCTVSGGGKSEISKPITDAILQGPVFVADFQQDFDRVEELIERDYSGRFRDESRRGADSRAILSPERSLGSVIKLLTPASREYTDEYNAWLESIPQHIKELVFVVKRFYKASWGKKWREQFSVDKINGIPGNELKLHNHKLVTNFMRVGYDPDGSWRTFGLRKDFHPAAKLSVEDDITVSLVVPRERLDHLNPHYSSPAVKFVQNCEYRLFQRPDDAIYPGLDRQAESDFSRLDNFFSNYEPLTPEQAREIIEDSIGFDCFTEPMQRIIREVVETGEPTYFVSSAHPRLVDGKRSTNPRYLQQRGDLANPRDAYLAAMGARMHRRIPTDQPLYTPVNAVLPGRRNHPPNPAAGIRALAVYNPLHYMELPELFLEFISSMTGHSPATTGAGSEGALTKGPFNALPPVLDLNNALVSYLLTGDHVFISSAGYCGPKARVDHDISLLIPEVWCRMSVQERDPGFLIRNGYLEKCEDFFFGDQKVLTSRLGYRVTRRFVKTFFGRVFNHPHVVFPDEVLRPEKQGVEVVVEGMDNIVSTQKRVGLLYFEDGSIELAYPPLKALLHIMAYGHYEGRRLDDPAIRMLFTRENMLSSDWYAQRLASLQASEIQLWRRHLPYLEQFLARPGYEEEAERLGIPGRLEMVKEKLEKLEVGMF